MEGGGWWWLPRPPQNVRHPPTLCTSEAGDPPLPCPREVHAQVPPDCRWGVLQFRPGVPRMRRAARTILLAAPCFPSPRVHLRGPSLAECSRRGCT